MSQQQDLKQTFATQSIKSITGGLLAEHSLRLEWLLISRTAQRQTTKPAGGGVDGWQGLGVSNCRFRCRYPPPSPFSCMGADRLAVTAQQLSGSGRGLGGQSITNYKCVWQGWGGVDNHCFGCRGWLWLEGAIFWGHPNGVCLVVCTIRRNPSI
jgi:hypothetical protein